jgi:para-nitrobenzyl esterase
MRAFAICLSIASATPTFAQSATSTRVQIEAGTLVGSSDAGVLSFKGIPFAAPPVGPLRWRAPQAAAAWTGERDATRYGHDCMQLPFPSDAAPLGTPPSEDCLYANVWRPARAVTALPVMVWIYGGGFVNGGSSPPTYSGAALAAKDIIVVSFNYRLGRFGVFAHPSLTKADADGGLFANYGYMDQLAALRWVQRNIARFGGDPTNVTIVGESAGGMSVHALLISPQARGLFHKAVIQSGGPTSSSLPALADAQAAGTAFARSKGIAPNDPQAIDKLRALPADQVVDGLNLASRPSEPGASKTYVGPLADGKVAVDPVAAYRADRFVNVPVMVGATSDDIGGADGYMISGARSVAGLLTGKGVPVYYYRFSYVADSMRTPESKGAKHATDIPFFFNTEAIKYGAQTSATDRAAGQTASGYLVNFVKKGDPNGGRLPKWPAYSPARPAMQNLDEKGSAEPKADPAS